MSKSKASKARYRMRVNHKHDYQAQTEPLFDSVPDGFGVTTSGTLDPVEEIISYGVRVKGKPRAARHENPTDDSFSGHYTSAPSPSRVQRTNEQPGSDRDANRHWQRRECERELDAETPLDAVFPGR